MLTRKHTRIVPQGRIDQVSGLLTFEGAEGSSTLRTWDHQVLELCGRLNDVIDLMSSKQLVNASAV